MKKTLLTCLVGAALFAPAFAQTAAPGNPRTEAVDVTATDKLKTQTGTGVAPREAQGQSKAGFTLPNRTFRAGSPTSSARDVTQYPAPPAALPANATLEPTVQPPTEAPPAIDVKNAGDTTLNSSSTKDITQQQNPPSTRTPDGSPQVNETGTSQNPGVTQYSTKQAEPRGTLLPSPTGPRNSARSTTQTPGTNR